MIPDNPYFWRFPDTAESHESSSEAADLHESAPETADSNESAPETADLHQPAPETADLREHNPAAVECRTPLHRGFTNPFRYIPDESVVRAGELVIERLTEWSSMPDGTHKREVERSFAEGKMLGVLVCAVPGNEQVIFIAGFSGSVKGADEFATSSVDGFVPPIIDLTCPDGYFKKEEAVISELNRKIEDLASSEKYISLKTELIDAERERDSEIERLQSEIRLARMQRDEIRSEIDDPAKLEALIRESQFQKAELKRAKDRWKAKIASISQELMGIEDSIREMKALRSSKSDALQKWIFENAVVHNAKGESLSIWNVFTKDGLIPPGGTGDCAAPKLLNHAYTHGLTPLAMGEFWYGKSPDTAVRTEGHFYPSCTSKCGPLLGYMLQGLSICSEDDMLCRSSEHEQSIEIYNCHPSEANHSVADSKCAPATELKHIYEDESIIIIEKPSGMPSVPGLDGRISAQELLGDEYHAVHRLDMDTSGVMIFAKTSEAAVNLRRQFEEHTIRKTYQARICRPDSVAHPRVDNSTKSSISEEHPMAPKGNISLPLSADYDERPRQKVDFIQGKPAHTDYELLRNNPDGTSDILLYPHTGRTHQLRVHCAHTLGLARPIVGDLLYGAHSVSRSSGHTQISQAAICCDAHHSPTDTHSHARRLCLHALSITFCHPATGEQMTFTSDTLSY